MRYTMATYWIVCGNTVSEGFSTEQECKNWIAAGNCRSYSFPTPESPFGYEPPDKIVIMKEVAVMKKNKPILPKDTYGEWKEAGE
jgi:hypothetical protein